MSNLDLFQLLQHPLDALGVLLYVLIFPVYHTLYPLILRIFPTQAARTRFDRLRSSWIEGIVLRRDYLLAAQQTRNLTMVNTLLASSSLILMGFTANMLIELSRTPAEASVVGSWGAEPGADAVKLLFLVLVFGVSFAYSMTALRHLGHFNLVVGADPDLIEEYEVSATEYLSSLINRASNRHTLAVRCLYSATPLFLWLFDVRLFIALTLIWGLKFLVFQDFAFRSSPRRKSRSAS